MSLKDYWPFPEFRAGQERVLEQIEAAWESHDVIVVRAPTAFGKEPLSVAVQNWQLDRGLSAAITVPNNALRDQVTSNWGHLKTIRAMKDYWLEKYNMSELEFRRRVYKYGTKDSEYNRDKREVKRVGNPICVNYHSYIAHKLQRNVVIVDEAHLLLNTLQDMAAKKIWHHKHKYPLNLKTLAQVKRWVDSLDSLGPGVERLQEELESLTPATLVEIGTELYRGEPRSCLKLIPLSVENHKPIFWPRKTQKIVLVSATIGPEDVKRMGLGTRRTAWIDAPSPIPAARRAIRRDYVGSLAYHKQDENLDALVAKIRELRDLHEGNGFVHASYALARKIREKLRGEDWAMFHSQDSTNKREAYAKFTEIPASERKVMIGSGFSEGIDMKYDIASWQLIAKVPYPSLADAAMRWVATKQASYYNWLVSQDIMQACGRVCRAPDDIGITYIADSSFEGWLERSRHQLPLWFLEALEDKHGA